MTRNLCIVLGDQLSQNITSLKNLRKEDDKILMMEVVNEATYVNHQSFDFEHKSCTQVM